MNVVRKTVNHNKRELVTLVGIFFICIFFTVMDSSYLSWNNFLLILQQSTINGIIAVGMTFAIMTGGIDLSVGAVYGIVIVAIAKMTVSGWNPILSLLIGLLLGCAAGCINGLLVTKLKLQPFVVGKIMPQAKSFTREQILSYVNLCVETEEAVKTGRLNERLAVEFLIVKQY